MKRLVSVLLFFAVTFLIFHDQMILASQNKNSIDNVSSISYKISNKIDLHEQLHAYTISFDKETIVFTDFPQILMSTLLNSTYSFITFNPPYRPPSA